METAESSASLRGVAHEARDMLDQYESLRRTTDFAYLEDRCRQMRVTANLLDPISIYESRRRTTEFALKASLEREQALQKLVSDGPGICAGARTPVAGSPEPTA